VLKLLALYIEANRRQQEQLSRCGGVIRSHFGLLLSEACGTAMLKKSLSAFSESANKFLVLSQTVLKNLPKNIILFGFKNYFLSAVSDSA
jgi:hypothetical protein